MLFVRLLVNRKLLVVVCRGVKKLYADFQLNRRIGGQDPKLPYYSRVNCISNYASYQAHVHFLLFKVGIKKYMYYYITTEFQ